jgi:hypothetical protein
MRALATIAIAVTLAGGLSACDVDKTQEGKMPKVDVDASGGQLPNYDVDVRDVQVGTETRTITTPEITTDKEQVQVPVVGLEPAEPEPARR